MIEVKLAVRRGHGHQITGSGQNGNEAVKGATSEAFARWLHHQYASSNCHHRAIPCNSFAMLRCVRNCRGIIIIIIIIFFIPWYFIPRV